MNIKFTYPIIALTTLICASPLQASEDHACIAKQLHNHQQAEQRLLHAFGTGDHQQLINAAVDIAASETYLQVCGFDGTDSRLLGALNHPNGTPESFAAAVFHKRLQAQTGFRPEISNAFSEVNWSRVEGTLQ